MISSIKGPAKPVLALLLCGLLAACVQENDELTGFAPPGEDRELASLLSPYVAPNEPDQNGGGGGGSRIDFPPPVRPANANGDDDQDLLRNGFEFDLIKRFAPNYWLHSREPSKTIGVDYALARSGKMRFARRIGVGYSDVSVPGSNVSIHNLGSYTYRSNHTGTMKTYHSSAYYDIKKEGAFYMKFPTYLYDGHLPSTRCYALARISPDPGIHYEIQYWWFYAYNPGRTIIQVGAHSGDWENVIVRVTKDMKVHSVIYYQHGKPKVRFPRYMGPLIPRVTLDAATNSRPNVYSAFESHASYARSGRHSYGGPLVYDRTDHGWKIDCARRFVNIGNRNRPSKNHAWMKYFGKWGGRNGISSPDYNLWKLKDWNAVNSAGVNAPSEYKFWRSTQRSGTVPVSITSLATKAPDFRLSRVSVSGLSGASIRITGSNSARLTLPNRHNAGVRTARVRVDYTVGGRSFTRYRNVKVTFSRSNVVNPHDEVDNCGGRPPRRDGSCI